MLWDYMIGFSLDPSTAYHYTWFIRNLAFNSEAPPFVFMITLLVTISLPALSVMCYETAGSSDDEDDIKCEILVEGEWLDCSVKEYGVEVKYANKRKWFQNHLDPTIEAEAEFPLPDGKVRIWSNKNQRWMKGKVISSGFFCSYEKKDHPIDDKVTSSGFFCSYEKKEVVEPNYQWGLFHSTKDDAITNFRSTIGDRGLNKFGNEELDKILEFYYKRDSLVEQLNPLKIGAIIFMIFCVVGAIAAFMEGYIFINSDFVAQYGELDAPMQDLGSVMQDLDEFVEANYLDYYLMKDMFLFLEKDTDNTWLAISETFKIGTYILLAVAFLTAIVIWAYYKIDPYDGYIYSIFLYTICCAGMCVGFMTFSLEKVNDQNSLFYRYRTQCPTDIEFDVGPGLFSGLRDMELEVPISGGWTFAQGINENWNDEVKNAFIWIQQLHDNAQCPIYSTDRPMMYKKYIETTDIFNHAMAFYIIGSMQLLLAILLLIFTRGNLCTHFMMNPDEKAIREKLIGDTGLSIDNVSLYYL